ncbi:hypothetical protein ASPCAL13521 [Aspergillus calidoustus]|uniref:Uncharacterized protein n=1 Tax=Aspergillus calidoustus TaxID=454130 RepID=A0A0U5GDD7_ASPCI|nr:hypothetical protein ASPCAL13521 [Aspergillus calidoustus]
MASVLPPLVTTPSLPSQDTIAPPDAVPPGPFSPQTHVYPVQPSPPPELQPNPQPPNRGLRRFLDIRNLLGFLWLAPALALLILNFRGHIIGAGLNCPGCRINPYSTDRVRFIQRLDRTNRNVLGALQFVAKALEVWFMYVAGSFVYRSVLFLSAKDRRLPISLLLVYAEFMDLLFLKDLAVKARELARDRRYAAGPTKPVYPVLFLFILLVAALSIIANLMGVATATLAIPSLQFVDINKNDSLAFRELLASAPPRENDTFLCPEGELTSRRYSCTELAYSSSMDELVESAVSTTWQYRKRALGLVLPPVSREDALSFSLNRTEDDDGDVSWVPNRQLLRDFTVDATNYYHVTYEPDRQDSILYPDSDRFSQALQTQLQRRGPALGMISECQVDREHYIWEIAEDRQVHCYPWVPNPDQGRCIRWGSGWKESPQTTSVEFTMPNITDAEYDLTVTIYATPMARWVLYPCWADGSCPWDQIFEEPAAPNEFNISGPQLTYIYSMPEHTTSTVWCYNVAHLGFADYTLDPNPLTNYLGLVQLSILNGHPSADPKSNNRAVATVHPDWVLAAWSVSPGGEISPTRGSIGRFSEAFLEATAPEREGERINLMFSSVHTWSSAQVLSFINYDTATISSAQERGEQEQRVKDDPLLQSFLPSWATVQVWKFGIESRTSILGVVIMTTGVVIVLLTTILWIEPPKTPTGLVVGALLHSPPQGPVTAENGVPVQAGYDRTTKEFRYNDPGSQVPQMSTVVVSPKP